jgi:hypothetical protein
MSESKPKSPKLILPIGTKIIFMLNNKTYIKKTNGNPFSLWKSPGGGTILIDDDRVLKKDLYKILTENEVNPNLINLPPVVDPEAEKS